MRAIVPGSNLLAEAFALIAQEQVRLRIASGRVLNTNREYDTVYSDVGPMRSSWQPLSFDRAARLGLDESSELWTVWIEYDLKTVDEDRGVDQVVWRGGTYDVIRVRPWYQIDGWSEAVCQKKRP